VAAVDLLENVDFTLRLLKDSWEWRTRSIEELQFSLASHVRARTRYQCRFPRELLDEFGLTGSVLVRAAIPLGAKPKRELLRYELRSEQRPVYLLERRVIAEIETADLRRLFHASGAAAEFATALNEEMINAICSFMPGIYESFLPRAALPEWVRLRGRIEAVRRYLENGLGLAITKKDIDGWLEVCDAAGEVLARRLEESRDHSSASECPLLALPFLPVLPASREDITKFVQAYGLAVKAADTVGDAPSVKALVALAEYGRRWEMIVESEVPTRDTFELSVEEDRPLGIRRRGWAQQSVILGDARSAHVAVSVFDPNVSVDAFGMKTLSRGRPTRVALAPLEDVRHTPEALSFYSSDEDRPYLVSVAVRLRTAPYIRWTAIATALITASAIGAVLAVAPGPDLVGKLTLLTLPTTVAATFVLVREQTALATLLERTARCLLGLALVGLWGAVLWRVMREGHLPWTHDAWHWFLRRLDDLWWRGRSPW
jgi:hypothetical protein